MNPEPNPGKYVRVGWVMQRTSDSAAPEQLWEKRTEPASDSMTSWMLRHMQPIERWMNHCWGEHRNALQIPVLRPPRFSLLFLLTIKLKQSLKFKRRNPDVVSVQSYWTRRKVQMSRWNLFWLFVWALYQRSSKWLMNISFLYFCMISAGGQTDRKPFIGLLHEL